MTVPGDDVLSDEALPIPGWIRVLPMYGHLYGADVIHEAGVQVSVTFTAFDVSCVDHVITRIWQS